MLSAVEAFTICVLLFFGTSALKPENGNDPELKKSLETLDHQHAFLMISDRLQTDGKKNGRMIPLYRPQTTQEIELGDQLQTNVIKESETELNKKLSTTVQGTSGVKQRINVKENHDIKFSERLATKEQENQVMKTNSQQSTNINGISAPSILKQPDDQLQIKTEEKHERQCNKQQSVRAQDNRPAEPSDQLARKLQKSRNRNLRDLIQIDMTKNTALEKDTPSLWMKMETRQSNNVKGPLLGFRRRSLKLPHSVSRYLSKKSSFMSKRLQKQSSRNDEQFISGQDNQSPSKEEVLSDEGKLIRHLPTLKSESSKRRTRALSMELTPERRKQLDGLFVAKKIKNIVMIPGSGEFVYDTKIQQKIARKDNIKNQIATYGSEKSVNEYNIKDMSDAMLSLEQLKEDLPSVEWVSVVVNWFADSIYINECEIYPAVEFKDDFIVKPDDWQVGHLKRDKARLISRDSNGNPRYGGTVSDGALTRYLNELHRRKYKVMLYPMLVLDTDNKEWRGKLTGLPQGISNFFRNKYNTFINHYSIIARESKVEGFIIGSELVGLTRIRDWSGNYPAVSELVKLAQEVKVNLGKGVTVTYAADWTEYSISYGGWYPMDELWSSEFIDVVGINAYFPLTEGLEPSSGFSIEDITHGWSSGEGFDYYGDYSTFQAKRIQYKDRKWAVKDIEYWWGNRHYNPDGTPTRWVPEMKKIWFTEFGFASVDACTNDPYIFVDSSNQDSPYPRYSNKKVNFRSQRIAIEGTLQKWHDSNMVEKTFLYAWDARPFPYFPVKREVWGDGANWETGHWIQGKIRAFSETDENESVVTLHRSLMLPKRTASSSRTRIIRSLSDGKRSPSRSFKMIDR